MRRPLAAAGSAAFLVLAPGTVAVLVPWLLTGWRVEHPGAVWALLRVPGVVLATVSAIVLIAAFARFAMEGRGTPAPVAPTERLVVGGSYRYVRNPMYVAVVGLIVGQALLLGRPGLLWYALVVWLAVAAFVRWYEEPTLSRRFGAAYDTYRRAVPAWLPRRSAWDPGMDTTRG
jgi:protein-S-isoprenylcysteine O-methyltransferase Ste14